MLLVAAFVLVLFLFSLVSRPVERSPLTAPIVFTAAGLMTALLAAELPHGDDNTGALLTISELGLVFLLFADASHVDLKLLKRIRNLPARLLGPGMLLTVGLGAVAALLLFDRLNFWEAVILAAVLAPTDAGLGQAIVTDPRIPRRIREALNVEAGLNDGLAVPFLLFSIAMAGMGPVANEASLLRFIAEQIGYGVVVGLAVARGGAWLAIHAHERDWIDERFAPLAFLMMPLACLLTTQAVDGSAFIAAFVAGLALPRKGGHMRKLGLEFIADWGQLINLAVFFLFGVLFAATWPELRLVHFLYGALSLTVIRMLPVAVALTGSGLSRASVGFIGWFGPRGLASIVLGLVYIEHSMGAKAETINLAVTATVLLSILAHGLTAKTGVATYARVVRSLPRSAPERKGERVR